MKKKIIIILLCLLIHTQGKTMDLDAKIYVAGHNGLVGSALMRTLQEKGYTNIITKTSRELDLRSQQAVENFFENEQPEYVFLAAAKVGGIKANNDFPAEFIYDNIMITSNIIHSAYKFDVKKLLFLGSSCIYPRNCPQPIKEEYLLNGYLEKTNEPYAIAKIAGIKLCESYNRQYGTKFISCMPTNLYGPNDNFDLETSHVLPALLAKMVAAQKNNDTSVVVWGTGSPRREFLFVDDLADALIFLMNHYESNEHINVGTGTDITIKDLALLIKKLVEFESPISFDTTKPDGTPQKLLNINRLQQLGWQPQTTLEQGIKKTLEWYRNNTI